MKKQKRPIERLYNEKVIIGLVAAIFILLSVYLYIVTQVPARGLSYYKRLSSQIHEQIQSIVSDAKGLTPSLDYIDLNNSEEVLELQAYYSMLGDLEWLAEKENVYFEEMQKADTKEREQELAKKEIASGVVIQYMLLLNAAAMQDLGKYDEDQLDLLIKEAQFRISNIKNAYLNEEILGDIAAYSGLKVSEVEEEIKELMNEYIELRKKKLADAIRSADKRKQYIEAKKMLMLAGSFQ
ncbi:MAG: hypothetical protein DRO07_02690 [Candidatus Iainarchaeum archaeon]|uniref:Uncharacterized protein n=1 Tax=Candidatus Iainarchaeum sp. TaxID=3101447 RepID=A0A497JEZ8_9ARCH|nr:MAG: hypothetical protein DRO07_02690 [Candidatus Diapherotrites archaeon]